MSCMKPPRTDPDISTVAICVAAIVVAAYAASIVLAIALSS